MSYGLAYDGWLVDGILEVTGRSWKPLRISFSAKGAALLYLLSMYLSYTVQWCLRGSSQHSTMSNTRL